MINEPGRQSELAVETLKIFVERGEDLSDLRHAVHYFYGGDFKGLGEALRKLDYNVRPTVDNDGVIAEKTEVTDERWRKETLTALSELANRYGTEYDGWEAALTRQGN